ncbi:LPS export ABC transporter periplasmic protein LptC [Campylobacter pinnipediorum]|uniref:LPS export ABC transporter periplasmic protein LptC n=1 Tax=Campylobacter pinnipediorum subsp. pinnipediorum TaxID=1660067 RepID=A0AAX0LC43_9BACT|nr:LPS export ABC transporter periplasmic protein LptC [Campylobacter pinnipediorum]AQW81662.1 putative lipooligosaccharide transport system, substrate-binding component (LptC family) [Campylobacter pinnipediorum subsp. pinnipediorum]AQW83291.1 putative lipooligosaccharide transport system, substrate-binding component (LptC family) [Campylobacter pinnipediorum subsp. pinnipediorum]AQW84859.1 putative lipooligosaccharide transport system, substrate-binding component (LptC family) [Campylobacter p
MVIKIFYIIVTIFSISMVFLASSNPYMAENFTTDFSISNIQINDVVDYEIDNEKISAKYEAKEINRYKANDELVYFRANFINSNLNNFLKADKAIIKGEEIKLRQNVNYENNQSLTFKSQEAIYHKKDKTLMSNTDFVITKNENNITGTNIIYDLNNKITKAKGVKIWINQN